MDVTLMSTYKRKRVSKFTELPNTERNRYHENASKRVIEEVCAQMKGKPLEEVFRAVRSAYPFGDKKGKPYKIWIRLVCKYEAEMRRSQSNQSDQVIGQAG